MYTRTKIFIVALAFLSLHTPLLSQQEVPIAIDSYYVTICELAKPVTRDGIEYKTKYLVHLRGKFSKEVELFLGDLKISEYTVTDSHLTFAIYDKKRFEQLHNRHFSYYLPETGRQKLPMQFIPVVPGAQEHITILSYDIAVQEFATPCIRRDEDGARHRYDKAYVVSVNGQFGPIRAVPVEIYIGNYKIREYGTTAKGIYFYLYDESLLEKLAGKPFAYGREGQQHRVFALSFQPQQHKPFRTLEKK